MLSMNKSYVKCINLTIFCQGYSQTDHFKWHIIPHTSLRCYTEATGIPLTWRRSLLSTEWCHCNPMVEVLTTYTLSKIASNTVLPIKFQMLTRRCLTSLYNVRTTANQRLCNVKTTKEWPDETHSAPDCRDVNWIADCQTSLNNSIFKW